jgi:hypothetical protein
MLIPIIIESLNAVTGGDSFGDFHPASLAGAPKTISMPRGWDVGNTSVSPGPSTSPWGWGAGLTTAREDRILHGVAP